jgi:hypothetical protein
MAKSTSPQLKRITIPYFEGINSLMGANIAKIQELSMAENARSSDIGVLEKRKGYRRLGDSVTSTANYGLYFFDDDNASSTGFFRVMTVSATTAIYYLNTSANWTTLAGGGSGLTGTNNCSFTIAEGCLFFVNGTDANRYVKADGTTVVTSATATGHLKNSPVARKINFYKDRLYIGDYTNTTRYKTGVMMSSMPLGIVALVDGDHATIAIDSEIKVTDIKYILSADTLDVYRGGTKIADITIDAKDSDTNTITIDTVTMHGGETDFKSSDEIWVDGTYTGVKVFRWADNPESGIDVKQYDTFKLTGGDNSALKMLTNIGDVQMIANKQNMAIWDDYRLQNLDLGIGCVSSEGYVKALGTLFFLGYNGIYATTGGVPKLISAKIQKIIDGATKSGLEAGAMGRKGLNVFCFLGDVTLYNADGSIDRTLTNTVVEYNLRQETWYVHTGIDAKFFHNYVTSTDVERLEYSGSSGNVYELLRGTSDDNSDEIPFRVDTNPITLSKEFENIAYPKQIIIEVESGSAIQCFISLDKGDWYEIQGESRKGCSVLFVTAQDKTKGPARCRKIAISIRDYSKTICKISRVAIAYSETLEEEIPYNE